VQVIALVVRGVVKEGLQSGAFRSVNSLNTFTSMVC